MKTPKTELPTLQFRSAKEWEKWLARNHQAAPGLWIRFAKKESGEASLTYAEAVESALCYGWIDGQAKSAGESFWLQRYTPRRPRSKWSKRNCQRAEQLIVEGRMTPAGLREVEAAKSDGRWAAAYDSPKNIQVPPDLQSRLDASPRARDFFATLSGQNRYAILYRIHDAKKPETRERRIGKFVAMLEGGKTVY